MSDYVEVIFSAHASQYDAKPGDRIQVPAEEVPGLVTGGIAAPATKAEAKAAGLDPEDAASARKK